MEDLLLNLEYGCDTKINLEIKGIKSKDTKKIVKEAFSIIMKKLSESDENLSSESIIEKAYSDLYLKKISEKNDSDETPVSEKAEVPSASISKEVRKVDTPKTMEELLVDIDPRTYRNHGGVWRFQVYYICEKCHFKGRAFVEQRPTFNCRECGHTMKLIPATDNPFPFADEFGNFYVAGKYKRVSEYSKILAEKENSKNNDYQFKLEQEMVESDDSAKPPKLQVK